MKWSKQDTEKLTNAIKTPFCCKSNRSKLSVSREKSCYSPEVLFRYLIPQIKETLDNNLGWETPEEWDKSFRILGGGQKRRTSVGILSIITWEQFIDKVKKIKEGENNESDSY